MAGSPQSLVPQNDNHIVKIRDPQGNIHEEGDPGVTVLKQAFCTSIYIDIPTVYPNHPGGTWELILEGQGDYSVQVMAQTSLHMDYMGRHVLQAGKPSPMRVQLFTDNGAPAVELDSVAFQLRSAVGGQSMDIELFDDGQHGDREAGDGLFGGRVSAPRGIWRIHASGELADGSPFDRIHPVPIRVQGFRGSQSADGQRVPGNVRQVAFEVSNENEPTRNSAANQVYELGLESSMGWASAEDLPPQITLAPGESRSFQVRVAVPPDAAPGEVEETSLVVMEQNNIASSDVLSVQTFVVEEITNYLPLAIR